MRAIIPSRSDQRARYRGRPLQCDPDTYCRRSIIECCIGWLKKCRHIATRFEKLDITLLAVIKVALMQRYHKILFSNRAK